MPLLDAIVESVIAERLRDSSEVAKRVPLLHVDPNLLELIVSPPHEISPNPISGKSDNTRRAEEMLGLSASVYFYAGRAHPQFGNAAFAFPAGCEASHSGSVSPFDTGGLLSDPPRIKVRLDPTDGEPERVAFGKASQVPLGQWREAFGKCLAAYFAVDLDYWHKRPSVSDPEGIFELNDDWRAWTFEIRFHEGHSIHDRIAWCADESVMNQLRRLADQQPLAVPGDPLSGLDRFLAEPTALDMAGTPLFCGRIEQWVVEQVAI